jgi:hypothetical protein
MKITDISLKDLTFGRPSSGFMGGQFVSIQGPIVFQTPRMDSGGTYVWVPHGAPDSAGKRYWYLSVTDPMFDDFIQGLETRIIEEAIRESESWFGSSYEPDVIRSWFTGSLFGEHPRRMRFMVPGNRVDFFDEHNNSLTYEDLPKSGSVAAIVTLEGIWFRNRTFGIGYKLNQVKYYPEDPTKKAPPSYAFLDDES